MYSVWPGGNPEYDADDAPLRVHVAGHAAVVVRLRPRPRAPRRWSSASRCPATTPSATRAGATVGDGLRRHPGADLDRRTAATSRATARAARCSSTATAPTRCRSTRRSPSARVSLLDRGVVFAIAHVRGGGELGRRWYEDGKLLHKTNTFTDFVACAEHLVRRGLDDAEPARRTRRQRGRAADGRDREPPARPLPRRRRRGAVRRLPHHDARRDACRSPSPSGRSGAIPVHDRARVRR